MLNLSKITPALAAGCTVILKPAPDTPYSGHVDRQARRRGDRHPAGRVQRRHRRRTRPRSARCSPAIPRVDMISFTGSTAVGKRITAQRRRHPEARVPRARRQVGEHRARRRRLRRGAGRRGAWCACTRGQGCAITTRLLLPRSRYDEGVEMREGGVRVRSRTATRPTLEQHGRARSSTPASASGCSATSRRARPKARAASSAAARRRSSTRATSCSRRCSSTSTPTRRIAQEEIFGPVLVGHPVRRRRRRGAHRQQLALRPVGRGHGGVARPGARRRPPHPHRHGRR